MLAESEIFLNSIYIYIYIYIYKLQKTFDVRVFAYPRFYFSITKIVSILRAAPVGAAAQAS
jgi:amino acid permease